MGGNWSPPPNLPIRSGSYINFESSGATPIEPGTFGRVAMPIKATWGPKNDFVDIVTDADRRKAFGSVANYDYVDSTLVGTPATNTSWLVAEAIRGGSQLVKVYRMVGAGSAPAAVTLKDWVGTDTLVLTAKYDGTRANSFKVTIAASPVFTSKNLLTITERGITLEEWLYNPDDLPSLISDLNDSLTGSDYVIGSLASGMSTETDEVTELKANGATFDSADKFKLQFNFGNSSTTYKSAEIAGNASDAATVQSAINTALTSANIAINSIVVTGAALDSSTSAVLTMTATGALAKQNISVTVTDVTGDTPAINVTTQGKRSPLTYGTFNMASGNDGATIQSTDYTNALSAFEAEGGFDLFSLDGISNEDFNGIDSSIAAWAITNNEAGRYVMAVVGGGVTEQTNSSVDTALTRSALYDTEWVVNIGCAGLNVISPCGVVLALTPAQCAPRLAGIIASAGIKGSITFNQVTDVDSVCKPVTPAQIEQLIKQGVVVFSKRGNAVRIEDGITTFISLTTEKDFTFTQIRAVRAIQQIGIDLSDIVERDWIGKALNTTNVRSSLVAVLKQYFRKLEAEGVLVNGTSVSIDARYDNTKTNVFILVLAQFQFELKRVLLTVRVPTVS